MNLNRRNFFFLPAVVAAGCARGNKESKFDFGEPKERYVLEGVILRLNEADRTATIKHQEIKGWMEAMTMEFPVPKKDQFAKLKEGMKIRATVLTNDRFFWLDEINPSR